MWASQVVLAVENPSADAGNVRDRDIDLTTGSGRPHGKGNNNPLQYSCLKIPKDRRA